MPRAAGRTSGTSNFITLPMVAVSLRGGPRLAPFEVAVAPNAPGACPTVEPQPHCGITRTMTQAESSGSTRLVAAGAQAPPFELHVTPDQTVALSEFHGRPV